MKEELILPIFHFPKLWFKDTPAWWLRFIKRMIIYLDNQLAVSLMAHFWLVPVWQDTTIIGRVLSLLFRTSRLLLGSIIILLILLMMVAGLLLWLLLPVLIFIELPVGLVIFPLLWFLDFIVEVNISQRDPAKDLINQAQGDINKLYEDIIVYPETKTILFLLEKDSLPAKPIKEDLNELLKLASLEQKKARDLKLKVEHLVLAFLSIYKFHHKQAQQAYLWLKKMKLWKRFPWIWEDDYPIRPIGGINRAWTGMTTPELNKVSDDLTQLAAKGKIPELVGREKIIDEVVRILGREGRENVIIIGEPGSGKTALVQGLANEIIRGTKYKSLQFKRLIALDVAAMTARSPARSKERLVTIVDEILSSGNVILFVDEIHNLISTQEGQLSAAFSALEPHLDAGDFQFVATTTPAGYKRFIEPSEAFARTFRKVNLPEASAAEALDILQWRAFELERDEEIKITFSALVNAIELSRRYIHDRVLPDSAIDLLEEAANKAKATNNLISTTMLEELVTEKTKIPVRTAESQKEKEVLLNLEKQMHKRLVGQNEAITEVADALRRARAGMTEEGRLLAGFLFAGATGVGKTETAKTLAHVYFGSESSMVRLDMSEYQTPESINKLIGPPPGQPEHEAGGQLTEAVRRKPFTVILLDEIEKASPNILDVFLQVLDDARLTDGAGRTVDFSNTIVIATSNIGTSALIEGTQQGVIFSKLKNQVFLELRKKFRPEFLNRFSGIVVYKPLTHEEVKQIAAIMLAKFMKKMAKKEIKFKIKAELLDKLAEEGYSPVWGARELRRVIRDQVEEKIAKLILQGKIKKGESYTITPQMLAQV